MVPTAQLPQCDLHYLGGGSDKVYCAKVEETAQGRYSVLFAYGRRGSTLTRGAKVTDTDLDTALRVYDKLVAEKTGKGYRNSPGVAGRVFASSSISISSASVQGESSVATAPLINRAGGIIVEKISTGIYPQLLNPIDEALIDRYLSDPMYGAQEKKDGRRLMVEFAKRGIRGINKQSFQVDVPPAIHDAVLGLGHHVLLDGEAIGDILHTFGVLEHKGIDLRDAPYGEMYDHLVEVVGTSNDILQVVPLYKTEEEKRALYSRLKAEKKEGIVFKHLHTAYFPQRPASMGPHLKFKFTETVSCVVLGHTVGKRSVKLGLYLADNDTTSDLVPVGNVTIPANHPIPQQFAIVEIQYLYARKGGALYQPIYLGERDDIDPGECWVGCLKYVEDRAE